MYSPSPDPCPVGTAARRLSVGLPACNVMDERRFPLTPEAVALLTEGGVEVMMQQGAGAPIHYTDEAYTRAGARICDRDTALGCEVVVHLPPLSPRDTLKMRRGATLLTLSGLDRRRLLGVKALLERHVLTLALDMIRRGADAPFADALAEAQGAGSIAIAAGALADSVRGKGILLGGVAGVPPCEVVVMGSGIAARAAARAAGGLGAVVRIFDNDIHSLRSATASLWPLQPAASSMQPHVLEGAFRTADVVVMTDRKALPGSELLESTKKGVLLFDLVDSMTDDAGAGRRLFTGVGSLVARTSAMALSNALVPLLLQMSRPVVEEDSRMAVIGSPLQMLPSLQRAALTYMGRVVYPALAKRLGLRSVDISIYLSLS